MKLTCTQNDLNTHLSLVARAIPSRPSHPVLANVLFAADADTQQITLTGFDLSMGIQTSFPAQIEDGGTLTLPAKLFSDIISHLPDGDITMEEDGELTVIITSKSGKYKIRGMSADEYPELPTIDETPLVLPTSVLAKGLDVTLGSASTDESKQVLTGVHITADGNNIELASTNGHHLSVAEFELDEPMPTPLEVTIPAKALRELDRMMQANSQESIFVQFDQGQLVFDWANQRLTTRLLEGQYPNYRGLIPKQFSRCMTVDRKLFVSALERIAVLADQKNNIVKLALSGESMVLSVDAQDVGSGRENLSIQWSGDDLDIAFNVKYLLEGLKVMSTNEVQMSFNIPTSPAVVRPLGDLKMTYLLMPVQIRS